MKRGAPLWAAVKERPLELSSAFIAVATASTSLVSRIETLSALGIGLYLVLLLGGLSVVFGRIRDELSVESAGYALLIAGFVFAMTHRIGLADSIGDVVGAFLSYFALVIGLSIRLLVVRQAMAERQRRRT